MSKAEDIPPEEIPQEQPLKNETKDEIISAAEPVAEAEQPETNNENQETENMEVHHHTHASHGKKNWKNYFWEFLMLFLAVFCGFLAEYQLEHKIERDREKQFINSLIADLEDDEKVLETMTTSEELGIANLDTLMNLLNNASLAKQNGDQLYYVARMGPRYIPFANNSRTFDQLKFSGGFRLIRYPEASNKIMNYYNQFSLLRLLEDNYNHEFDNYKIIAAKVLDPGVLRKQETDKGEILRSTNNAALRTYDTELLKELGFHTLQMNGSRRSKLLILQTLKKNAAELINYLKQKYHLE